MQLLFNTLKRLKNPPQSPNLNPVENLWWELEKQVQKHHVSNRKELRRILQEEWHKILPSVIRKLVQSMPRRLAVVIKAMKVPLATEYLESLQ